MEQSTHGVKAAARPGFRVAARTGYAASAWAFVFAAISFYWAAGGTAGSATIGAAITNQAHDPTFIAVLWGTGALKALGGLLALALVHPWSRSFPRRLLLIAAWAGGILMALYGGASWVQEALMIVGVISIPAGLGHTAALWHVLLWDPWWLLGGLLFIATAWSHSRRTYGSTARET
ncbi:MAG: DUF3995 domain-containing protein [Chloroflexota bacterium]|nr:DUF3995 domain-containing protein [Chloroflexota bacterium]